MMRCFFVSALLLASLPTLKAAEKPNVLFIAIDDQNDWIGHLGGHPMAKTPHLDKLASRGTTFLNAHCNMPLCNPSRTSLLLGLRPTTTGIYGLSPWFRTLPEWKDRVALPQHFAQNGYRTGATGKIYHGGTGGATGTALAMLRMCFALFGASTRPRACAVWRGPMAGRGGSSAARVAWWIWSNGNSARRAW
jgi:hypothetical protein